MKPLSKQDLIKETKRIRDSLVGSVPDYLMISNEQIEKNVEKKYDVYAASFKFMYKSFDNKQAYNKFLKEKNQKRYVDMRDSDIQGLEPQEFEKHAKEMDNPLKAKNYLSQSLKKIVSADYQELTDVALNLEKLPKYLEKNSTFVNQSMAATSIAKNFKHKSFDYLEKNKKVFEGVAAGLKSKISFNSHPFSMLFEGYTHNLPFEDCVQILNATIAKPDINPALKGANNFNTEEKVANDAFVSFTDAKPDKEAKIIHDYLVENNLKNLMEYKPVQKDKSLQDAIFEGSKLVRKTDEEIKEMNDDFNVYERDMLEQKVLNEELLSEEEFKKYNEYNGKSIADNEFDDKYFNYVKELREAPIKREAAARAEEKEKQDRSCVTEAVQAKLRYEKQSRASKFFSRMLPSAWTKTGRLRRDMNQKMDLVNIRGLSDRFEEAYKKADTISPRKTGFEPSDEIARGVAETSFANERAKDQKALRDFVSKSSVGRDIEIDTSKLVDEDEDEMETPTPKTGRKSIEIAGAKDTPNSSKENVAKEQSNQKAMEASNEMDDDELDLD